MPDANRHLEAVPAHKSLDLGHKRGLVTDRETCQISPRCLSGLFLFQGLPGMLPLPSSQREFYCRISASLAKDLSRSPRAKLLNLVRAAHGDGQTGRAYLRLRKLEEDLACGRKARARAEF